MTSWLHPNEPAPASSLSAVAPIPGRALLAHVQDLLPPSGRGPLPDGGEPLPDEPPRDPSKVRFGGGSLDGIMSVRGGRGDGDQSLAAASAVISLIPANASRSVLVNTGVTGTRAADGVVAAMGHLRGSG